MSRSRRVAARITDVVLVAVCVGVIVLALAITYQYQVSGSRRWTGWVLYDGVAVALVAAALAVRPLTTVPRIVVTVSALLLPALACSLELHLEAQRPPTGLPKWYVDLGSERERAEITRIAGDAGVTFDLRDRSQVVADLRGAGVDAVPLTTLPEDADGGRVFPLVTMSDRDTVLCNESGQWVVHRTDEHGFNNPKGIWSRPKIDVVALGESFTYGYCVPADRNYVALIRGSFPATLNLGFSGGPLLMSAVMREYVSPIKPRIVLWFHTEGIDLGDLWRLRDHPLYQRYLREPGFRQGLMDRQREVDAELLAYQLAERARQPTHAMAVLERVERVTKLTALRKDLARVFASPASGTPPPDDSRILGGPNLARFEEIVVASSRQVARWGGRLYFVYLPHWDRFGTSRVGEVERSRVLSLVRAAGIPVIDTVPDFERHGDPLSLFPFRVFGHYNEAGNRLVARAVLKVIGTRPARPEGA